jgi:hypothetical protein
MSLQIRPSGRKEKSAIASAIPKPPEIKDPYTLIFPLMAYNTFVATFLILELF